MGEQLSLGTRISDDGQTVQGIAGASRVALDRLWKWTPGAGTQHLSLSRDWVFYKNQLASVEEGPIDHRLRTDSGLVDLPGLAISGEAPDLFSRDGKVATGATFGVGAARTYRWSEALGVEQLSGSAGSPLVGSRVSAASSDGSVLVGTSSMVGTAQQATLWRDGMHVGLGFLSSPGAFATSDAVDVSGDGSVIVGTSYTGGSTSPGTVTIEAFVWTQDDGMKGLGFFPATSRVVRRGSPQTDESS